MKIAILGSGVVGQTLGGHLARNGQDVVLGTRTPEQLDERRGLRKTSLREWLEQAGSRARIGTFAEAAAHGEVMVNATAGTGSIEALQLAGAERLAGKVLMDVANPLDYSQGMPPSLAVCNTDSLGEQIQRTFPDTKVVKTLNTMTAAVMIDPASIGGGEHHVFVSGNDGDAKREVAGWLESWFGWRQIIDLGDITTARGTEMLLPLWIRLVRTVGTPMFNFRVVR